jgi:hypothetical protein
MRRMTTLKDHERRITALEENERATTDSLYKFHRFRARTELRMAKMMRRMDLEDISEDEIDEFLDQE